MPSAVFTVNVTSPGPAGESRLTVKLNAVVPELPSFIDTSLIESVGTVMSSFVIVPCPCVSPAVAPLMLVTFTKKVSSAS